MNGDVVLIVNYSTYAYNTTQLLVSLLLRRLHEKKLLFPYLLITGVYGPRYHATESLPKNDGYKLFENAPNFGRLTSASLS